MARSSQPAPPPPADWVLQYNATVQRGGGPPDKSPSCLPMCCVFFAAFGAAFCFCIAAAMKIQFGNLHIEGDMVGMSRQVTYAGAAYLVVAVVAFAFWLRQLAKPLPTSYSRLQ